MEKEARQTKAVGFEWRGMTTEKSISGGDRTQNDPMSIYLAFGYRQGLLGVFESLDEAKRERGCNMVLRALRQISPMPFKQAWVCVANYEYGIEPHFTETTVEYATASALRDMMSFALEINFDGHQKNGFKPRYGSFNLDGKYYLPSDIPATHMTAEGAYVPWGVEAAA